MAPGFDELAEQLELRLLNAVNTLGSHYEFVVLDDDGGVVDPQRRRVLRADDGERRGKDLATEMVPDEDLAWTVTAAWRIKRDRGAAAARRQRRGAAADDWLRRLTAEILDTVPVVRPARTEEARAAVRLSEKHLVQWRGLFLSTATVVRQGAPLLLRKCFADGGAALREPAGPAGVCDAQTTTAAPWS